MLRCVALGVRPDLGAACCLFVVLATSSIWAVGAPLHKSGPIQISADGAHVWWTNRDHGSVSRLRTVDDHVDVFPLPAVGPRHAPRGLAIDDDHGRVWVACEESSRIYVLDALTGGVLQTHVLDPGSAPVSAILTPDGAEVWVVLHRAAAVVIYDAGTMAPIDRVDGLFRRPFGLAFDAAGSEAWITHTITEGEDSHVSAIGRVSRAVIAELVLKSVNPKEPSQIAGDPDPIPEGGYLLIRGHLAPPPGQSQMWLPVQYHNFHNPAFTPDSSIQAALHKIDTATDTPSSDRVVLTAVYAHDNLTLLGNGWDAHIAGPIDLAFDAGGTTAYLANQHSNDVLIFPTSIGMVRGVAPALTEVPVGDAPIGLVASPTTDRLYVLNWLSRDVSVIDTATSTEIQRISATPGQPEPFDAAFLNGARLFHTSNDPRISSNEKIACASCHPDGDTDGLFWEFAPLGAGHRKTLSLRGLDLSFGAGSGGLGQLHRSGDRDEVQDFDFTFAGPFMGGTGFLPSPSPPLGSSNAGIDADLDAIAAYLLGLPPIEWSPRRTADGSLSEAAIRGAAVFQGTAGTPSGAGCDGCHTAPLFTDLGFHDVGGFTPAPENEGPPFNTPTLVGAWSTAPYVQVTGWQDGQTLAGVVRHADEGGHGNTSGLNEAQRRDLVEFLESIDGTMTTTGIGGLVDDVPPRVLAVRPISLTAVDVIFDEMVDATTAENPAFYVFDNGTGTVVATEATVDPSRGNRVRVEVALEYPGCPITYTLLPGPIEDAAALHGAPANNVLDPLDPGPSVAFTIDGAITVTFGNVSGLESLPPVAIDAGFNAGLSNVSHDHWRLYPSTSPEMKGFVAFDFVDTLIAECGVTSAAQIIDARFTAQPQHGNVGQLELRRCLMPWGEPPNDWCFGCGGSVTRSHATYPSIPWHQNGAGSLGGSGTSSAEYYPTGSFDLAATVDATVDVISLNQRAEFAGPAVRDAFRFWFDHPTINFGYAVEVSGSSTPGIEFEATDSEEGRDGFVLSITFTVPASGSCGSGTAFVRGDCNADGSFNIADAVRTLDHLF
ncbi:MAG: hypothetical protein KDC38_08655, partial [Planctomycetes bacterium]|nr:hypothetical protein [Planctomycetota bacterium]